MKTLQGGDMVRKFGFFLMAAVLAAAPAAAQDKPVQVTLGGGYTSVMGAAADHGVNHGGNFTLGVIFNVNPVISIQGEYAWNGMQKKRLSLPVNIVPIEGGTPTDFFADGNMQYGTANMVFHGNPAGKSQPYGIVGLGLYYRPVAITTPGVGYATVCDPYWYVCYPTVVAVDKIVGERSSTDFGMNFGGGVNFKMTDATSIYFEVRYHYIWGPEIPATDRPTGGTTTSFKANGQFLPITVGFRF
jgi:opacity protein-like surface antigen